MGHERRPVTARLDETNLEHISGIMFSRWPPLSRSEAINLALTEHRMLASAGILSQSTQATGVPQQTRCTPGVQSVHASGGEGYGPGPQRSIPTGGTIMTVAFKASA